MTTHPTSTASQPSALPRPRTTPAQNVVTVLVSFWLMIGIFVDGWAHNHFGASLETFFTPWHAIFYSGFLATALWVGALVWRGWREGRRGLGAVPVGYELGVLGVFIFGVGGLGDLTWHTVFGIEVGTAALLSPTHLLLFLGAELLAVSPLSAAWQTPTPRRAPAGVVWPAVLSMTATLSFASFMHMYLWALVDLPQPNSYLAERALLAGTLLTALMLAAPVLLLLRRWQLPFGAVTAMYLLNTLLMRGMTVGLGDWSVLLLALVAGLAADGLIFWWRPAPGRPLAYRAFAVTLPLLVWVPFYVGALSLGLLSIGLELWAGICVMTALGGLALSALIVPSALPGEART